MKHFSVVDSIASFFFCGKDRDSMASGTEQKEGLEKWQSCGG
jgi:hypothetical protein